MSATPGPSPRSRRPHGVRRCRRVITQSRSTVASWRRSNESLADLSSTLTSGKLRYLLAALDELPRAALVVEDRYSAVFKAKYVTAGVLVEGLAEAQVRFPGVPIVFCETRPLAQEWTYRFLGAALSHHDEDATATERAAELPIAGTLQPAAPTAADIRAWAKANGHPMSEKGRIPASVREAFDAAQ